MNAAQVDRWAGWCEASNSQVSRGGLAVIAGLVFTFSCAAAGPPEPESGSPLTPIVLPPPEEDPDAAMEDGDDELPKRAPPSDPCRRHDDPKQFEDCLKLVSPGDGWSVIARPPPPYGHVCAIFGHRGPNCEGAPVRLAQRWTDGARDCGRVLTLHWAPSEGDDPRGRPIPLGSGRPSEELRPYAFDSDGVHFAYLRVDDYIIEGMVRCLDHSQVTDEALVEWGRRLQPQIYNDQGKGRP